MAKVSLTLDDVVLSLRKGKRVVADRKQSLNIPATVSSTGKRRNMRLDISDQGEKILNKAIEDKDSALEDAKTAYEKALETAEQEYEKAQQKAWDELNKVADKITEIKHPSKAKTETQDSEEDDEPVESDQPDDESNDQDESEEAVASEPSTENYASPTQSDGEYESNPGW